MNRKEIKKIFKLKHPENWFCGRWTFGCQGGDIKLLSGISQFVAPYGWNKELQRGFHFWHMLEKPWLNACISCNQKLNKKYIVIIQKM